MFKEFIKQVLNEANRKAPSLLTGVTVAGIGLTLYYGIKAGMAAKEVIDERDESIELANGDSNKIKEVKKKTTIKLVKIGTPVTIMAVTSMGTAIGSNTISNNRIALLGAAYSASRKAAKDLDSKLVEVIGDKKVNEIKQKIATDKATEKPIQNDSIIVADSSGDILCKDLFTGLIFKTTINKIDKAIIKVSRGAGSDSFDCGFVELASLLWEFGITPPKSVNGYGWSIEDFDDGLIPVRRDACITTDYNGNETVMFYIDTTSAELHGNLMCRTY